ncbi:flagellum-specific ATP synthase [Rubricella aquisinus]|uniref:Flagellum-specific ATP synthase n=1 Tax=Rubricella aquisinus TaxID=2028108 RepID=A0A840X3H8_9RHOB|nr:flagellum-specific ATP synthase FliI [Rubricella aquisinus]MBB5515227.1 flagellum-specific ATP synthase [Rubricella aquisinus]
MTAAQLGRLASDISHISWRKRVGRIIEVGTDNLRVAGLGAFARIGQPVQFGQAEAPGGEVIALTPRYALIMPYRSTADRQLGEEVMLAERDALFPDASWLGRVVDAFGAPLDGKPLPRGGIAAPLLQAAPNPLLRASLGSRLRTGLNVFDTALPLVRGQRIGVFAGSGVGKTQLLAQLGSGLQADVVVLALIGERGRELRATLRSLPAEMCEKTVCVVATSDRSALEKRRALWAAMAIAERFRDEGKHVLMLADSITRFAEGHRDVALSAGEPTALAGWPPSTAHLLASVTERAGPGIGPGAITAVFTVLVPGSDMEDPIADMARGLLDGHVVLSREIAERGRFPAIDLLKSVSRALPEAATEHELELIRELRKSLADHARIAPMADAGLHLPGADVAADRALALFAQLDGFIGGTNPGDADSAFAKLSSLLSGSPAGSAPS